ncbi:MAG: glutaredoxin family protein [Burkholderiaceae bacterium]|jgi:arsenate reductase-like glutaredoxin family protein|nr:glutaredoxin family protein [Burkholderiaceae bacterium]
MPKEYILYGTSGCHLCDEAESIVSAAIINQSIIFIKQDIINDDHLLHQYALTIPVFKSLATKEELCWPFTKEVIQAFIRQ